MSRMTFKRWLILAAAIFFAAIFIGVLTAPTELPEDIFGVDPEDIIELPTAALFAFIVFKNALAFLVSFGLAPLLLIMPLTALFANGWLIGVILALAENSLGALAAGILPHGIIEIPAFLIAEAAALSFGAAAILAVFKKEKRPELLPSFKKNARYLAVALLLLVPAAFIEAFVTPLLLGRASG